MVAEVALVPIFYNLLSFIEVAAIVLELFLISMIGKNTIPWRSHNCFLGNFCCIEPLDGVWVIMLKSKHAFKVLRFFDNFIGLCQLKSMEEIGQVFVNLDFLALHCKAPSL